jgi:hypothetical protein
MTVIFRAKKLEDRTCSTVTMAGSGPSTASPSSIPSNIILIPLKQPNRRTSQRITSTNFTNTNIPSVVSGFQTGYHFYLSFLSLSFLPIYLRILINLPPSLLNPFSLHRRLLRINLLSLLPLQLTSPFTRLYAFLRDTAPLPLDIMSIVVSNHCMRPYIS